MNAPRRWTDGDPAAPGEEVAKDLFTRGAAPVTPPSPEHLQALWKTAKAASVAGGAVATSVAVKLGLAAVVTGTAVGAWLVMSPPKIAVIDPAAVVDVPAPVVQPPPPPQQVEPPNTPPPPEPPAEVLAPSVPVKRAVPTPAPTALEKVVEKADEKQIERPEPTLNEDEPLDDAKLVVEAAAELNRGDAAAARAILKKRAEQFGRSEHSGPAGLVETEALRKLGRINEAIAQLDALERDGLFPKGRLAELPLIRAELLVAARRCDEARPLFEKVMGNPSFSARAQAGLVACEEQLLGQ